MLGYQLIKVTDEIKDWDILWSYEYPWNEPKLEKAIKTLKPHQRVRHHIIFILLINDLYFSKIRNNSTYSLPVAVQ